MRCAHGGPHYKHSEDGITWHTSMRQTYHYGVEYDDTKPHIFARMERPQLFFEGGYDEVTGLAGMPAVLCTMAFVEGASGQTQRLRMRVRPTYWEGVDFGKAAW